MYSSYNKRRINLNNMNIALVAHDGRKKELMEWVKYNWETLS